MWKLGISAHFLFNVQKLILVSSYSALDDCLLNVHRDIMKNNGAWKEVIDIIGASGSVQIVASSVSLLY